MRSSPSALEVPDLQRLVPGGGDGPLALGRHRHGPTQSAWPSRVRSLRPALEVPDLQRPVPSGDGPLAVGRHRHRRVPRRAFEGAQPVPLARSQTFSVPSSAAETARLPSGVTATAVTRPACPSKVRSARPLFEVPDLQRPVIAPRHRALAIRGERDRFDPARMPFEGADEGLQGQPGSAAAAATRVPEY